MTSLISAIYHREIKTVEYTAENGDRLLRTGGTLAWRLNNPGNLRPGRLYQGVIGTADTPNGQFAIFSSPEVGRIEKRALLRRRYNDLSLRDAIYTYAPPNENDSEKYLTFVMRRTGLAEDTILRDMSDTEVGGIMGAMEQMEGYNASIDSRQERWVHVTSVSLSDGSQPIADYPVRIQHSDGNTEYVSTNAQGTLPPMVTKAAGEEVILLEAQQDGAEIGRIKLEKRSRSIVFARLLEIFTGASKPHNPPREIEKQTETRQPVRYVVQPGDTLSAIATRFHTTTANLAQSNQETIPNPDKINPGQVIWIYRQTDRPSSSTPPSDTAPAQAEPRKKRYTVSRGDTLDSIASRHGITITSIMAENRGIISNPNLIHPGQIITIPSGDSAYTTPSQPPTPPRGAESRGENRTASTRSRENQGHPLAIIPLRQRRAPWMEHAYSEASRWAGRTEDVIGESINYHHELGTKWLSSLSGTNNAWCASFVNWCLQQSGYAISKEHYRARSFASDSNFSQIDKLIYGAIGMIGTSHVGFVYAKASNGNPIILGGNQSDQINFRAFNKSNIRYYVPLTYLEFARTEMEDPKLDVTTSAALNDELNISVNSKAGGSTR